MEAWRGPFCFCFSLSAGLKVVLLKRKKQKKLDFLVLKFSSNAEIFVGFCWSNISWRLDQRPNIFWCKRGQKRFSDDTKKILVLHIADQVISFLAKNFNLSRFTKVHFTEKNTPILKKELFENSTMPDSDKHKKMHVKPFFD